jgi:hypothetical protein
MSKRDQRRKQGSSWLDDANESTSLEDVTAQGYGLNAFDDIGKQERIVAKGTNIFSIYPDNAQPRRIIPSVIRSTWNGKPENLREMFNVWWGETQRERGQRKGQVEAPFDLGAHLEGGATERSEGDDHHYSMGPLESAFMKLINLAASIRRDGLTNPVTIASMGNREYQLETGERRWLAYHLLYAWFDGNDGKPDERGKWEEIPARKVNQIDVWRQATENNARDDLNAIGKARQYAVLMMDLHGGTSNFKPINTFANEREYYAQAADLNTPRGQRETLLNALGVSSPSVMTRLRYLLRLPDEIWQGGDDTSAPEDVLYKLSMTAQKNSTQAIKAWQIYVLNQNEDGSTTVTPPTNVKPVEVGSKAYFSRLVKHINKAHPSNYEANARALESLRELRDWIEQEEERISRFTE